MGRNVVSTQTQTKNVEVQPDDRLGQVNQQREATFCSFTAVEKLMMISRTYNGLILQTSKQTAGV